VLQEHGVRGRASRESSRGFREEAETAPSVGAQRIISGSCISERIGFWSCSLR
jgi:hypothetical protein